MRIVHLSTSDIGGGAARAAFRLHTGLVRLGVDSKMIVLKKQSTDPLVTKFVFPNDLPTKISRSWHARKIKRDFQPCQPTLPAGFELFSDDRSETGRDLLRQIPPCDIINLHWVAGLVDHETFFAGVPKNIPLVWRLADMGAMTGGCHYDGGCGKFTAQCGACPVLGSTIENDLSQQIWQRKHHALAHIDSSRMHLVGTSRWIAAEARRSSLLGRFASTIIPNGLDTDDFAPRDKGFARDTLGIPRDKKVVLFVADSSAIKRKGFDQLAEALRLLRDRSDLFLLSVGGRDSNGVELPQLHLGRISNDRMLSIIYSAADVFVIPSLQESFGQTVTESLACGTPVVGFNTGGIPDMVRPGITGYLAKVGDSIELAAAIGKVIENPEAYKKMSQQCRQIAVTEYSLEVQARNYLNFYQGLQ